MPRQPLLMLFLVLTACGPYQATTAAPAVRASLSPLPAHTRPTCNAATVLNGWSLQRLAAQTITVPAQESDVMAVEPEVAGGVGGVILFGNRAPDDLRARLHTLTAAAPDGSAPLIMTDEEGGAVQRMANLVGTIPSARTMGATMSAAQIQRLGTIVGTHLRQAGVTMDLAPVLDLDSGAGPNNRDPDGTRSFSADPTVATDDGLAFADGLRAGGIIPVVKHFPGLGGVSANTDVMPASTRSWSQLQRMGLIAFAAAVDSGMPAVMVGNAVVPGLTTVPASVAPRAILGVLRRTLHFGGLVITDSLSAGALSQSGYSIPNAAVAALEAGADLVLFSADPSQVRSIAGATVTAILAAVGSGRLPKSLLVDAVSHILTVKDVSLCPAR